MTFWQKHITFLTSFLKDIYYYFKTLNKTDFKIEISKKREKANA